MAGSAMWPVQSRWNQYSACRSLIGRDSMRVRSMPRTASSVSSPSSEPGRDRTTLAATTQNRPGSLLGLLTELAVRGIDLTRIESRPIKDRHAEYWFHLDCTGHIAEPAMGEALAALHRRCDRVRFLGSYPRAAATNGTAPGVGAPAVPEHGTDADAFAAAERWLTGLRTGTSG